METCRQYLTAHEWDVERAIETALISDVELASHMDDQPRYTTDFFPSAPSMPEPYSDEPSDTHPRTTASNAATTARYEPQPRL